MRPRFRAQLKHRLGYEREQDFAGLHRIVPINRAPEMAEMLAQRADEATTTTSAATPAESATPRRIFIDNGALKMPTRGGGGDDSSATSSGEAPEAFVRDARLAFLRSILNKIKQNAEEVRRPCRRYKRMRLYTKKHKVYKAQRNSTLSNTKNILF